jgi:acetylornithine deacetylase/succinyl-diaminopimelate desuccinylase-like protein
MTSHAAVEQYLRNHRARFKDELFEFLRIPSVSARSEHRQDVRRTAEWLMQKMKEAGLEVSLHDTAGHPIVLGEWRGAGDSAPTLLIYGHYDVQPPEPLELWTSPAFEPEIRDGRIYARGAVDDKGQLYLHIKAIEAHLKGNGRLPVNVIVVAEGEEEVGSPNLMPFVEEHASRLKADAVVISDSTMFAPGMPTIGASLRGLTYIEIRVRAAKSDLHSGSYGGAVANPATALARIIATFHDDRGHIAIPGFYDDVKAAPEFVEQIRTLPFSDDEYLEETGAPSLFGENGYTTLERLWVRPTCEVNGLLSGYTGEGAKTVLPAHAMAKVSCRSCPTRTPPASRRCSWTTCAASRRRVWRSKSRNCTAAGRGAPASKVACTTPPRARCRLPSDVTSSTPARAAPSPSSPSSSAFSARPFFSWASVCPARTRTRPTNG